MYPASYHCNVPLRHCNLYIILVLNIPDTFLRYYLDVDALEVDWETALQLLCAHPQNLHTLLVVDVWMVVLVEQREAVVPKMDKISCVLPLCVDIWTVKACRKVRNSLSVSMCRIGNWCIARKVVDPVQCWLVRNRVVASQQQVHRVGSSRSQRSCQLSSDKVGGGSRRQLHVVPHRVQLDVCLDVFGKLNYSQRQQPAISRILLVNH